MPHATVAHNKNRDIFPQWHGALIYIKIAIYAKKYGYYWCCFIGIMQISPVSFMAILKYKWNIFSKGNDNIFRNDQ